LQVAGDGCWREAVEERKYKGQANDNECRPAQALELCLLRQAEHVAVQA
jgi:hypothetical protein